MLTINLEKELLKTNERLLSSQELLLINQAERITKPDDISVLRRIGLSDNIERGSKLSDNMKTEQEAIKKFDRKRVFHISQIQELCMKYRLRFLPSQYYKGNVDPQLAMKVTAFELLYKVQVKSQGSYRDGYLGDAYVAAPTKSFRLEERPKDPLFFCKISNNYYYLIHKWGNDLSIFRRMLNLLTNPIISILIISILVGAVICPLGFINGFVDSQTPIYDVFKGATLIILCILFVIECVCILIDGSNIRLVHKHMNWNVKYIDED